ncbi:MAG: hypothetical protein GKR88_11280 [Flavobacteriaceae bacterium]|nr:MAG: hypothetical protein GKR88_11280 [Flavobacteriaceae bacterium]
MFNAINKSSNGKAPYTTLKSAFSTNKDRLTLNIVQSLFVFVLKKENENNKELREILLSLNKLLIRFCWEDFSFKNKNEIAEILNKKNLLEFHFIEVGGMNLLLLANGHIVKSNNKTILSSDGQKIILDNLIEELFNIKKKVQYKEVIKKNMFLKISALIFKHILKENNIFCLIS